MAIDPDNLERLTRGVVGEIEKRRTDSEARMDAYNAAGPKTKKGAIEAGEGPAGSLHGMGQIASNTRGEPPISPERAAEGLRKVGGRWVNTDKKD